MRLAHSFTRTRRKLTAQVLIMEQDIQYMGPYLIVEKRIPIRDRQFLSSGDHEGLRRLRGYSGVIVTNMTTNTLQMLGHEVATEVASHLIHNINNMARPRDHPFFTNPSGYRRVVPPAAISFAPPDTPLYLPDTDVEQVLRLDKHKLHLFTDTSVSEMAVGAGVDVIKRKLGTQRPCLTIRGATRPRQVFKFMIDTVHAKREMEAWRQVPHWSGRAQILDIKQKPTYTSAQALKPEAQTQTPEVQTATVKTEVKIREPSNDAKPPVGTAWTIPKIEDSQQGASQAGKGVEGEVMGGKRKRAQEEDQGGMKYDKLIKQEQQG